ncbi:hypothetical protein LTS18_015128, partial [Coniosporium uncinatum]
MKHVGGFDLDTAESELSSLARPLFDSAFRNAHYVTNFLVGRALNATKTGDQPYRNLLDIFTEDFLNVLGSSDWPAAELLLRTLLSHLFSLARNDKAAVSHKNMALDLMGLLGSGISDVQMFASNAIRNLDVSQSELSARLVTVAESVVTEQFDDMELLAFDGPYRVALEYLQAKDLDHAQLQSSRGYCQAQWSKAVLDSIETSRDDEVGLPKPKLLVQLRNMISDPKWLEDEYDFDSVSTTQGRLSSAVVALSLPFCRSQKQIFNMLLHAISTEQTTTKSRALKSLVQLLEKDPSILERGNSVLQGILVCLVDASSLVRDSALSLLAKCLSLKPALDGK